MALVEIEMEIMGGLTLRAHGRAGMDRVDGVTVDDDGVVREQGHGIWIELPEGGELVTRDGDVADRVRPGTYVVRNGELMLTR